MIDGFHKVLSLLFASDYVFLLITKGLGADQGTEQMCRRPDVLKSGKGSLRPTLIITRDSREMLVDRYDGSM